MPGWPLDPLYAHLAAAMLAMLIQPLRSGAIRASSVRR